MRYVDPNIRDALFRGCSGPDWIGRVQAVFVAQECVPIIVENVKYLVQFDSPSYINGAGDFQHTLFKAKDGGYFLPKLEHRLVSLWTGIDNAHSGVTQICGNTDHHVHFPAGPMANALFNVLLVYFKSYPNTGQYYFEADRRFAEFIEHHVFEQAKFNPDFGLMRLTDIAPPHYGFVIFAKRGIYHG